MNKKRLFLITFCIVLTCQLGISQIISKKTNTKEKVSKGNIIFKGQKPIDPLNPPIPSVDANYCSDGVPDEIVPEAWHTAAVSITWNIYTASDGLYHPTWFELQGSGQDTKLVFYPDRVDPKYLAVDFVVFEYFQKDLFGGNIKTNYDYCKVFGAPQVFNVTPATAGICAGSSTKITLSGSEVGYEYNLYRNGVDISLIPTPGTGSAIEFNVNQQGTYTIKGAYSSGVTTFCERDMNGSADIVVNPNPTATISGTTTICKNAPAPLITFTGANGTAPYTFTYNINGGSNQTITTTGIDVSVTIPVATGTAGTFTYNLVSVEESSGTTCTSNISGQSATVTVQELPTVTIAAAPTSACESAASPKVTFTVTNGTAPINVNYTLNSVAKVAPILTGNSIDIDVPTTTPGTFVYTLVSVEEGSAQSCSNTASGSVTVTINPLPVAAGAITGTAALCAGTSGVTYTVPPIANATSYTWNYSGSGATLTGTGNTVTISFANNATGGNLTVLGVNSCGNGVVSSPFAITVNSKPTATLSASATTACKDAASPVITLTGSNGVAPYTFTYRIGTNPNQTILSDGSGVATISVPTSVAGSFIYTLVSVTDNSSTACSTTITGQSATIVINPLPSASASGSTTVCQNSTSPVITFTGSNGTAPYTFTYTDYLGATQTITTTSGNSVTIPIPTASAGAFTVTLTGVQDNNSCSVTALSDAETVTVRALPTATMTLVGDATVCLNETPQPVVRLTGSGGIQPYTFTYQLGTNPVQTVTTSAGLNYYDITVPVSAAGTFTYTLLTVKDGSAVSPCTNTVSVPPVSVTVKDLPTATILGGTTVCQNSAPKPQVTFGASGGTLPYTINYTINTNGTIVPASIQITSGSSVTADVETSVAGTIIYTLVSVTEGSSTTCANTSLTGSTTFTISPLPAAAGTITGTAAVCAGTSGVTYTVPAIANATSYTWNYSGSGATLSGTGNTVTISFANNATGGNLTVLGVNSCGNGVVSLPFAITVNSKPTATLSASATTACKDAASPIITLTGSNGVAPYTFTYRIGTNPNQTLLSDVSGVATINVPTSVAGSFIYTLVSVTDNSSTACSTTITGQSATIVINPLPSASASGSTTVCQNSTSPVITFTGSNGTAPYTFTYTDYLGATQTITTTSGNSVTIPIPTASAGAFTVTLTGVQDNNSCSVTALSDAETVTVRALPTATMTLVGDATVCLNETPQPVVRLTGSGGIQPYTFTYQLGTNPVQTVATSAGLNYYDITVPVSAAGTFTYTLLTVQDGSAVSPCTNTVSVPAISVIVKDLPTATISGGTTVCQNSAPKPQVTFGASGGTLPYTINYTINTNGTTVPASIQITSGSSVTADVETSVAGTIIYTLVSVTEGSSTTCANTSLTGSTTFTISPLPSAAGTITGTATVCAGTSGVTYTVPAIANATSYTWNYSGSGATLTGTGNTVTISFANNATGGNLTVFGVNSCGNGVVSLPYAITVNPVPTATMTGGTSVCLNDSPEPVINFIGDNPAHSYTFSYSITPTGNTFTAPASVGGISTVSASTSVGGTFVYDLVSVTDNTTGCVNSAVTESETVVVNQVSVSLTTSSPSPKFCVDEEITYQATPSLGSGNYSYTYELRTLPALTLINTVANTSANIYKPSNEVTIVAGNYQVTVIAKDNVTGCTDSEVSTFEAIALPNVTVTPSSPQVCENELLILTATSGFANYIFVVDAVTYNNGNDNSLEINSLAAGPHTFYVTAQNSSSCSGNSAVGNVTVNPLPNVTLSSDDADGIVCETTKVIFNASGANTYEFFLDGQSQSGGVPTAVSTFEYTSSSDYELYVVGYNSFNCSTTSNTINVTVSKPTVTLNVNANPVCNGTPVTFEANGGSQYTFFENGTTVQGPIATNTYSPVTLINGNIYTAQAIDTYGCVSDLSTPITLTVNPIPSAVIVSDKTGDAVCSGSTITFTGSSDILGSEFEFYVNGTVAQAKSLNASFATNALVNGNQVHVVAYASTGCYSASTPITVTVNDLPPISIDVINPGTSVIEGTNVSFTSSVITGGTFSWLVNTTTVQPFGPSNSYSSNTLANGDQITVVGQDANGCQNSASVTMSVYESVQPLAVTVSPNGYCTTSATGVTISASNPQAGVVYELIRNSDNVNLGTGTISGTVVNWANIKNTGIGSADYRVEAYQTAVPSVRVAMANTVTVTEYALPLVYNVSPNNTVTDCNGGTGYEIKLSSSEVGVTYTLLRDGAPFGTPLAGTGNELSFGFQKTHGQYTISASLDAIGACSQLMNGTFIIDLSALGSVYNIASDRADGLYCQGDAGVRIYLDDTQNGVTYTLLLNGADQGTTVVGNGNAVDFGTFTTEGSYSAVVRQGGCDLAMNGTVNVTMIPTPKQFNLSIANNGHLCAGSTTGLAITLDGQQNGYTYHLYRQPAVLVESIVSTATDETTDLVFAGVTTPGTYYVSVASNGPGCTNTMANTVDVVVDDLPNEVTLKSDLPTICAGNTTVLYIEYAYSNTDYYLQLNGVDTGSPLSGNDGRLDFPAVSAPGTYSLRAVAHHTDTDCEALLTSTVEVITSALPEVRYITVVDGTTCANPTIVTVESTQVGVTYELFSAATNAIVPGYSILGDGNNQSFAGIVDADGHYYVIAHNAAGCQLAIARIDGTADIHVNIPGVVSALAVNDPNPLSRCVGDDSGFIISMPNSEATVSYVLIDPFNNEVETVVSSGGPLSFNPVTVAGTYTVRGYNAADPTCIVNMLNSINVVYTPLPAATLDASPATTIISGTDVTFTAGGGLYYQFIRLNGVPTLEQAYSADATFNSQFINNNDTIIAYVRDANGCESSAQVIMTVLPSIIVQPVYASATTYCVSSNGVSIMIANPQANVSYELFDGNNASRGVGIFDGTVVRWDNIKNSVGALETYRVEAYYPIYTTARVVMGSIAISEVAVPTVYSIPTETHNDCNSGAGYDITLSGSEVGVTYELLPIGTKIAGTGSALTFPSNTFIADYQVVATNDLANSCSILMDGTFTISIPTTISQYDLFSIRADGQFCQGSDGVEILLNNSSDVVAYSLWKDGQLTSTLTGINDTLSFGKFTEEALYRATADVNGCQLIMNGSVLVQEVETPKAFDVIADNNGHYCSDDASGVNITLQGQQKDVVYTLMLNGVAIIAETGKDVPEATVIPFGMYTEEGEYTIVAHIPGIGCTNVMNDTVYVVKDQLPANYELLATNSTYCTGGTTTLYIPNPSANTDYYLIKDGIITSDKGVINGNRIDYTISEAGLYGIYAEVHHNYTTCISQLADDKFITITESANPEARIYSVDDGYDCNNGDIVTVVASQIDITYSIYSNVTNDAVPGYSIVGTGSDISFPDIVDSNGSYYVVAENAAGCSVELLDGSGNRDFIVNIAGAVKKYMLTEPTSICLGDDGVEIVMQDSEAGIRYTLYNSAGVALQDSISIGGSFTFKEKVYNEDVYSVRAINPADPACENEMLNTVTVKYNPLPKAFNLTGSGFYCESTPALIGVGGSEWEVSYTLMYHKPTGKDFIETIQGSYYGDSIAFAGVLQEGIYSVYAKSEFGCTSSMKDSVVVKKQPTPQSFNVHVPVIQYCASAGGAEIYLSGMEQGVTYLVDNANSNEVISVKAESAQSDTTLLTKVTAGTYNVFATWGGDACSVQLNTTPIVISTAPVATVVPNISIDNSVNCYGQDNYIHVDNATASTIYDLMVDGVAQNLDINSDDATVQWNYAGIAGKAQLIEVLAYIDGYKECALRSDVKFVDTKASPAKFDVTPDTSYYCQGLSGVQLSVNNSEAAVLYELVDSISNVTISTFTPTAAQAGNPFTFTNAASAGKYIVRASYLSGCSSLMNNTAVVTMKSSLVNTPAILLDTNNGCSGEPNNVTLSNLENSSVYYLLVDGISTDTIITGESTLPADTSWVFNGTIDKNQTVQVQGFKLTDTECYLMSNVETVTTRQSPKVFDISPTDSTFCMGLDGVQITVSGSEVNVFYEVINKATQMREDYYMPVENDVPFTFRTPMLDGLYFVKARYLTGGCSSIMNNEADIKEDDGSNSTCIPLVAVPDVMYLSKNDITDTTVVWTNDTINSPLVDRIGDNIEFELIPDDGEGKETIGTVTFNALTGQFVYTKVPGFHGRDYFKYIIRNKNVNNRQDTALVTIMVGNYEMEGSLLIPNAFSPNGDEFNQTFVIDGMIKDNDQVIEVTDSRVKSSLEVYNRWGTLVYRSKGDKYNNDWDGTNKGNMISLGSDLPNGTYFYIFNIVVNLSNKTIDRTYNGFIELRR